MRLPALLCALVLTACGEETSSRSPVVHSKQETLRPTDTSSALMWRFLGTDVVESFGADGGSFKVHYTRAGINAVPTLDADDSGVPDSVEQVDATYEAVGALYHGPLGFRRPVGDGTISDNGGDGRFDVYLLDFARAADGAFRVDQCPAPTPERCLGYVVQENDFVGYGYPNITVATRILGSHEYFHAVQAAYDNDQSVVISEGTAVWATERFDPSTDDFENFVAGYLNRTDRPIDSPPPGPVPSFAYGSAIFFKFLTERHDDALIRKLWEHLENGQGDPSEAADVANPTFVIQLDALLKRDYGSSFSAEFTEFTKWNLYTGAAAAPALAYAEGSKYPAVASTAVTLPYQADGVRIFYASAQYFAAPAAGRMRVTAALVDSQLTTTDDLGGMVVWLVARKNGRNTEAIRVTAGETVDVAGGEVLVAVTNANRGPNGASLSQRPGVCIGTPDEVAACVAALQGGTVDAGVMPTGDAGPESDGGTNPPPPPTGCGCGMGTLPLWFLALLMGLRRRPL